MNNPTEIPPRGGRELDDAKHKLSWAVRDLAANILRIIAGAGKDYDLVEQCTNLLQAVVELDEIKEQVIDLPTVVMTNALRETDWRKLFPQDYPTYGERQWTEQTIAEDSLVQAALRMTAAQLVRQPTHEHRNHTDMVIAARELIEAKDKARVTRELRNG
jgi:hypothetical protein